MSQTSPFAPVVLAVDIGATKMAAGLVDSAGEVLRQARAPSPGDVGRCLATIDSLANDMRREADVLDVRVRGVGIACGGPLDLEKGLVLSPPNLPDWDAVPLRDRMSDLVGVPAYLQNDAAAGAIASYLWDNPDQVEDVTYITVSSGVGCGVVTNGTLFTGHTGNGSELGHIPMVYDGRPCKCGQKGCFEAYVSGTAIGERFSEVTGEPHVAAKDVAKRATNGDLVAQAHWADSMEMLKRVARAAVDLFDPALLCIGGGVTDAGDKLLAPAFGGESGMSAAVGRRLTVRRTGFGRNSGVASAAAVAWNEIGTANGRRVMLRGED